MRCFSFFVALLFALSLPRSSRADVPATEFFAIETAKLAALAPTDAALDALSRVQLAEISIAHGWYDGEGRSTIFDTATFRLDARFDGSADLSVRGPATIGYAIHASHDHKSWTLLSVDGAAAKQGKQYITEGWRKQPITVILRFLDLKH